MRGNQRTSSGKGITETEKEGYRRPIWNREYIWFWSSSVHPDLTNSAFVLYEHDGSVHSLLELSVPGEVPDTVIRELGFTPRHLYARLVRYRARKLFGVQLKWIYNTDTLKNPMSNGAT